MTLGQFSFNFIKKVNILLTTQIIVIGQTFSQELCTNRRIFIFRNNRLLHLPTQPDLFLMIVHTNRCFENYSNYYGVALVSKFFIYLCNKYVKYIYPILFYNALMYWSSFYEHKSQRLHDEF